MQQQEMLEKITGTLCEVLGADEADVLPDATLIGNLQATSLDIVDLLFQLKKRFGIQLTLAQVQSELSGPRDAAEETGEAGQGFSDALFEKVTVRDVANWVVSRLPA